MKWILLLLSLNAFASNPVGTVGKLRGKVFKVQQDAQQRENLKVGDSLFEGDHINTLDASFTKLNLIDGTTISVGPNSHFQIKELNLGDDSRHSNFNILKGRIRALIKKIPNNKEDQVHFNSKVVSIGVRGTEILMNNYLVKGAPVDDVALLEGKVSANLENIDFPQNNLDLKPGQAFNSNELAQTKSLDSVKTLSPENLDYLKANPDNFLPNLQLPSGQFLDVAKSFSVPTAVPISLPIPTVPTVESKNEKETVAVPVAIKSNNNNNANTTKALKDEPWDIRDAILNQMKLAKENECFYWFYKPIPGRGGLERFRRQEECDEDEEDYE